MNKQRDFAPNPIDELGGQALVEGVLMRSRYGYAVAVRQGVSRICVRQVPFRSITLSLRFLRLPVIRGAVALLEMLAIGTRALHWSAEMAFGPTTREKAKKDTLPRTAREALRQSQLLGTVAISFLLVVAMVVIFPNLFAWLTALLPPLTNWAEGRGTLGFSEENHPIAFNLVAGIYRAAIIVGYVAIIARHRDIRRVFQYHGAEHKAVLACEEGLELTVQNAQRHDTLHPRCGTSFIAVVVLLSIIAFSLSSAVLARYVSGFPDWNFLSRKGMTILVHVMLLPIIAGFGYELMKFCAANVQKLPCRVLLAPGLWFQRLTTRQPDARQVEVAIVALLAALDIEPDWKDRREYVVSGLTDDPSAPGYGLN